jgi:hypothetical protein
MKLHGQPPVRTLDYLIVGVAGDAQNLVIVAFGFCVQNFYAPQNY